MRKAERRRSRSSLLMRLLPLVSAKRKISRALSKGSEAQPAWTGLVAKVERMQADEMRRRRSGEVMEGIGMMTEDGREGIKRVLEIRRPGRDGGEKGEGRYRGRKSNDFVTFGRVGFVEIP